MEGIFINKRAGIYKQVLTGDAAYQAFIPSELPPSPPIVIDSDMVGWLVKANNQLALLEGLSTRIPNMNLFVSMYVRKEALMSSQIEGTQATLEDVFDPLQDENANRDVTDVINYIKATEFALNRRKELPLCNRLIKEIHSVLMEGVRGQDKNPGEFRSSQNWIGGTGSTIKTARYIPPTPQDMEICMGQLESYIHLDDTLDLLIQAGLIHYQFESIHPFLDGNGRIGRLLITLFLMDKGLLTTPALYISYFLKQNRIEYYDRMTEVRNKGNYEQWVVFFLRAVYESAKDAVHTIDRLSELHDKNVTLIERMGRGAKTAMQLFSYLESNPIIEIKKTATAMNMAFNTVSGAVNRLSDAGILKQSNDAGRNRTFTYYDYLDILRGGTL